MNCTASQTLRIQSAEQMRGLGASFACILVLLTSCTRPAPQSASEPSASEPQRHSSASLLIAQTAATPGSRVSLGITFEVENGWHIYWRNPGDSGEPPQMQWRLPAGVAAGTFSWPTPTRLTNPAGTDYGFEGTTVLLTSIQFPATAQPGTTIDVGGDLRWLVCHDICVPQRARLKAPVRIAETASVDSAARQGLQSAAERLPQPMPVSFRPKVTALPEGFRLTIVTGEPVTRAQFFPAEPEQIDNEAPQDVTSKPGRLSLTLKKSEYLKQKPPRLTGVIVINGASAFEMDASVQAGKEKRSSK